MSIPQLRVRTGYSTRHVYGRMPEIMARLNELDAKSAVIVDAVNTWGHVKFEQAAKKAGVNAGFGMEVPVWVESDEEVYKPRAWIIARDTRKFYNFTSHVMQHGRAASLAELAGAHGIFRMVGGAIQRASALPEAFDFVDINPANIVLAHQSIQFARKHGKPLIVTSFNDMPSPDHKNFAYSWEVKDSVSPRHLMTEEEMWPRLSHLLSSAEFGAAVQNTHDIAESIKDVHLQKAPIIDVPGDLHAACEVGKASRLARGHIKEWTQEYEDRLQEELYQIHLKEFESYFTVVSDLVKYAKRHMLVGPARGSAAGSLVCFLLDITEVDPIPYHLLFARFIDVARGGFEYTKFQGFAGDPYVPEAK